MNQTVVILDFGGQYTQLIARRVRQENVYSHVLPYSASLEEIQALSPAGIILSGGPACVLEEDAPRCDQGVFSRVCQCWAFVMGCNGWGLRWAGRWPGRKSANTAW